MKFVDDKNKKLNWSSRNWFWCVTIVYILTNIIIYASVWSQNLIEKAFQGVTWSKLNGIKYWLINIGNLYTHSSWRHVLHNMLALSFCSFYIERKVGSINTLLIYLGLTFLGAAATGMYWGSYWHGNSVIWFALWGYVLIDYLFSLRKEVRNKTNIIVGGIVLVLEYIRSGFFDTSSGGIGWGIVPYQLINNAGHYLGFIVGIIFALVINITILQVRKK